MNGEFSQDGLVYLSSRRACEVSGMDWSRLTDLIDSDAIAAKQIGHLSYIEKNSLASYLRAGIGVGTRGSREAVASAVHSGSIWSHRVVVVSVVCALGLAIIMMGIATSRLSGELGAGLASAIAPAAPFVPQQSITESSGDEAYVIGKYLGMALGGESSIIMDTLQHPAGGTSAAVAAYAAEGSDTGVVIVPSQGDQNQNIIAEIQESFSDEVKVSPSSDGLSGIIRPIFKTKSGSEFLYVMVPVK